MKRRPILRALLAASAGSFAGCVGTLDQTVRQTTQPANDELVDCFFSDEGVGFGVRNSTDTIQKVSIRIERDGGGVVYDETLELAASTEDSTGHVRTPDGVFPQPDGYVTRVSTGEETATDTRRVATQCDRPNIRITSSRGIQIRYYGHG
ncbi:hypothetical protein [Halorubellus salinus]|uniref:hypothetical protein n=1 Tax=Halorubellus salinus TaxID=755309 RepID=UPI001D077C02|nr:hypothetical protein [Halorubellus salinus]